MYPEIKPFVGKKTVLYKGEVETRNTAFGGTNAVINCKLFDIKDFFHQCIRISPWIRSESGHLVRTFNENI